MSIPYDTGWKCTADGTELEIIPVIDSTFSAAVLTPGTHEIKLTYKVPGLGAGSLCFIAGLICLVIFILLDRKLSADKKDNNAGNSNDRKAQC